MSRPQKAFGIYVFMFSFILIRVFTCELDIGKIHGYLEINFQSYVGNDLMINLGHR
jgi:hypothetical protein